MRFVFLLLVGMTAPALAQTNWNAYSDAVSVMNRKFRYTATGQPIGYGPTATFGYGLNLGAYLSQNSLVLLEVTNSFGFNLLPGYYSGSSSYDANGNSTGSSVNRWDKTTSAQSIGLHYKQFLMGSFYGKVGIVYRRANVKHSYRYWSAPSDDLDVEFSGHSFGAALAIGNQWHIGYFTIGCDWVGYVFPFSSGVESETYTGNVTQYARDELKDRQKYLQRDGTLQLARLYIGASF